MLDAEPQDPVVDRCIQFSVDRMIAGHAKYKQPLSRTDLSELEWRYHLQAELDDAAKYNMRLIMDLEAKIRSTGGIEP